jgi:alanyl-tRNA synthetase
MVLAEMVSAMPRAMVSRTRSLRVQCVKGGGGGKPELATAGGKDPAGTDKAVEAFLTAVKAALGGMK